MYHAGRFIAPVIRQSDDNLVIELTIKSTRYFRVCTRKHLFIQFIRNHIWNHSYSFFFGDNLVVIFGFLPPKFWEVTGTYKWYLVIL